MQRKFGLTGRTAAVVRRAQCRLPGVDKLESSVKDAEKAFAKLETEIENLTGSACAKTLQLTH